MPGFNSQVINGTVETGNQVAILIGDLEVGFGQTSMISLNLGAMGFYRIGTARPHEIQQLRYVPAITIDEFFLTKAGEQYFGYPSNLAKILAANKFQISVLRPVPQGQNGQVGANSNSQFSMEAFLTFVNATANDYSLNIPANEPIMEAITFLATDILDSDGVSILNGTFGLSGGNLSSFTGLLANVVP